MPTNNLKNAIEDAEIEVEEIAMQLADMLGAALYFSGIKKDKIPKAVDAYLQGLDDIFDDDEDMAEMGFEEVIKVIESLKASHPNLYN